jgi:hypothetical protein
MAMLGVAGDEFISVGAAATGDASPDVADASGCGVSAVAFEFPEKLLSLPAAKTDGDESSEAFTGDILESGHGDLLERLLCQVAARRFSGGPSRYSTMFCGGLQ